MQSDKKPTILVDFEDAFSAKSGIPISLVNDVTCLLHAGFTLILWYSSESKTPKIKTWLDSTLSLELQARAQLLCSRPSNFKMWIAQLFPWLFNQRISCDFVYMTLFPRVPIRGFKKQILRIYDPFTAKNNFIEIALSFILGRAKLKNIVARAIRNYSYCRLNKAIVIKVYSSKYTRNLCYSIYGDIQKTDSVIYPVTQFAIPNSNKNIETLVQQKIQNPYFIFIGGQRQKKDPLSIINLWASNLNLYGFNFVVIGKISEQMIDASVKNAIRLGRLMIKTDITTEELEQDLLNSEGVVYNTLPDGFGYPVAEAIYLQKPVICNDLEVFREIGGDYPYFFDSGDFSRALTILASIIDGTVKTKVKAPNMYNMSESITKWQAVLI